MTDSYKPLDTNGVINQLYGKNLAMNLIHMTNVNNTYFNWLREQINLYEQSSTIFLQTCQIYLNQILNSQK